jgi:hypothetical protein
MDASERRTNRDDRDTGIEILPGVVSVDLTVADVGRMTVDDLREAMEEAAAQENEADLDPEEILGGLDISPQ